MPRPHPMVMPFPFTIPRGLILVALLAFLPGTGAFSLLAQEPAPATAPESDSINYPNASVNSILDLYEQLSGLHLIRDASILSDQALISLNASGLDKPNQLKMIEEALLLNGVVIVPVDNQTAKVVLGSAKNPRSEGLKIYANAADLPANNEVVTYYMPLNYITPTEAQSEFNQYAPAHPYGVYVPAASAQAIILVEDSNVIRQLIALKELIDVPPAQVVTEFIQLHRADAEKIADLLTKLLEPTRGNAAGAAAPGGGVIIPARLGNDAPLSNEHSLLSGSAQIVADTRSNQLMVVTRPVNLPLLRQMIAQLDQSDTFIVPQRRDLKYVLAQDILPALEASLAQGKEEEAQIQKETPPTSTAPANNRPANSGVASSGGLNGNNTPGSIGSNGSNTSITPGLQAPAENNAPTVVTIGKTKIVADNRSNAIIVFGSADASARVFNMIDQLDHKPLQVYLATVIGQLTVSEGMEFGIDILQKFQRVGHGGLASSLVTPGTSTSGSATVPEPSSLTSAMGFPLPTGLTLYGAIGSTLNAYVRALESTDRFKVISTPSVYTSNNKLAIITNGSQIPVPSSTTSGFTGNDQLTTTSSIQYENVLLELDIIPLINANHDVTLQIHQTNDSQGGNNIISGNNVPTILTQEINTEITVPDKSTVVIGGLISDTTKRDTSGVPWLSDIPVLGYLFKDTSKSKERDELIIMIQPTVVETVADQIAANEAEKQKTILGREAIEASTPSGTISRPAPEISHGQMPTSPTSQSSPTIP